jgi:hypothetical protein
VLRFYGVWDCRSMLFGDEINVKLHYSLAENTIEVVPINGRNSGRDRLPKLLKKTMILKKPTLLPASEGFEGFDFEGGNSLLSGESAFGEEKSAFGGNSPSTRDGRGGTARTASPDARSRGGSPDRTTAQSAQALVPSKPYHWTDLKIGLELPVASMTLLLIDADEFTREFYSMKSLPLDIRITRPAPEYPSLSNPIPPYNGFGSEEDSLQTCKQTLVMHPPAKDGLKLKMLAGMILRYEAILAEPAVSVCMCVCVYMHICVSLSMDVCVCVCMILRYDK